MKNLDLAKDLSVGILLSNPIDILEIYFACIQINRVPIIMPIDITNHELQKIINDNKINFFISEWLRKDQIKEIKNATFFYNQELSTSHGGCASIDFSDKIKNLNAIQSMHLTSGSTGSQKLIGLSFNNFIHSVEQWNHEISFKSKDRYIQCLPLNHIAGLSIAIRSQIVGFETILMDKYNSSKINYEIDNGATIVSLIPSMLKRLLDNRSGKPFPKHLKAIIIGGASCSDKLIKEAIKYNAPIYKTYGMTETCSGIAGFWVSKHPDMIHSSGKSFNQTKINIIDSEISISGPTVTPFDREGKKTNQKIKTFDLGFFKRGFLFLEGRTDDIVISAGENISLSKLENTLINHPNIVDIYINTELDDSSDNKIIAYVKVDLESLNVNDIYDYCKKYLSINKIPFSIEIVDSITDNE